MKKFIYVAIAGLLLYGLVDYLYYWRGFSIDIGSSKPTTTFVKNVGKEIYLDAGSGYAPFEIKGVDIGNSIPGHFATDYAITKEDYLRWFDMISDMGANTVRVYTILHSDFYDAVYEYNHNNDQPLYLIQGLWVNDYVQNSHKDAYDKDFAGAFLRDGTDMVDVIHGRKKRTGSDDKGSGFYTNDISPWVIGYILGVDWEDTTVAYTDHMQPDKNSYAGEYMSTTADATPFEAMLAQTGDQIIEYETKRYQSQRLVAFSNWPTTDPFDYEPAVARRFYKITSVDVENIKISEKFISGTFASYHVYPYFPDYLSYHENATDFTDETGRVNTYRAYLKMLNDYHTMPVVISEFGVPSSRGMAQRDHNTGRDQGNMSESQQAQALVDCYKDIRAAGCAGSIIFLWQDEWFKSTWNTMHATDLTATATWSDYQTNEQSFGLLAFDPGREKSVCYVDGDVTEWSDDDLIISGSDSSLSLKYDEKFIYIMAYQKNRQDSQPLYIPIDVTPKSGSAYCQNYNLSFDRNADFVIAIDGKQNSRVVVQERYDCLRAMFYQETHFKDAYVKPPAVDSPVFKPIELILQVSTAPTDVLVDAPAETYETGLLTYGNANPESADFNSLADFCFGGDYVEIKLPWQLLNFRNPAKMSVHDDYYLYYGVEPLKISGIWLGISGGASTETPITLSEAPLKGWGKPTAHERLKSGYYAMQEIWRDN